MTPCGSIGFATLVTQGPDGIEANHLPLLLDGEVGILRGHVARANPVWKHWQSGAAALAIYLGPHAYVSPNWYPTKAETGKAVPTWNYLTVHARGTLSVIEDADWLRAHVAALSDHHEAGRSEPWTISDAPRRLYRQFAARRCRPRNRRHQPGGQVEAQPEPPR